MLMVRPGIAIAKNKKLNRTNSASTMRPCTLSVTGSAAKPIAISPNGHNSQLDRPSSVTSANTLLIQRGN